MGIPASALRRALQEMAEWLPARIDRNQGVGSRAASALVRNGVWGGIGGGAIGGMQGAMSGPDADTLPSDSEMWNEHIAPAAGIGAGVMAGLVGLSGARGLRMGLREALARAAEERGLGRAAQNEAGRVSDALRFHAANEPEAPMARASHAEPDAMEPDMDADDAMSSMDPGVWFRTVAQGLSPAEQMRLSREATDTPSGIAWLKRNGYSDDIIETLMKHPPNAGRPFEEGM